MILMFCFDGTKSQTNKNHGSKGSHLWKKKVESLSNNKPHAKAFCHFTVINENLCSQTEKNMDTKKFWTNKFNSFDIPIMQRNLGEVHDNLLLPYHVI